MLTLDEGQITALTGLLVAIGTGIGWLVHRWDKKRKPVDRPVAETARAVEDAPEVATEAVKSALKVVTQSVTSDLARVRADAKADRDRYIADRRADRERMSILEKETEGLRADVDELRRAEGRLIGWVAGLHKGIEDGTIPPLPPMPPWLTRLLHRAE